jgi:anti-sigma-K factor RskA
MALLAAGLGVRLGDEREARTTLAAQLGRARQTLGERERALAEQRALVAEVVSPDARTARLAATGQGPDVRVTWNRRTGLVVLTAASLGPAPAGRTYQLWGIPAGGAPQSLGTFAADAAGSAGAVLRAPAGAAFGAIAVSVEPAGGSPAPTTTPILVGQVGN